MSPNVLHPTLINQLQLPFLAMLKLGHVVLMRINFGETLRQV